MSTIIGVYEALVTGLSLWLVRSLNKSLLFRSKKEITRTFYMIFINFNKTSTDIYPVFPCNKSRSISKFQKKSWLFHFTEKGSVGHKSKNKEIYRFTSNFTPNTHHSNALEGWDHHPNEHWQRFKLNQLVIRTQVEVSRKIIGDHAPSPEDGQVGDDTDGSEAANRPNERGEPENGEGRENEVNEVGRCGDHATRGDCRRKRGIAEFVIPIWVRFCRDTCLVFAFQRENLAKRTDRKVRKLTIVKDTALRNLVVAVFDVFVCV